MRRQNISNASDALAYLVECQLATVVDVAMKKSRRKADYARHQSIAQIGVDWLRDLHAPISGRAESVLTRFGGDVTKWAQTYEPKEVA